MDQAVADGLTVSIKYHPRIAKVLLDDKKVQDIENYYEKCADDGATEEETNVNVPDTASNDNNGFVKLNSFSIDLGKYILKVGDSTNVIVKYNPSNASVKDTTFISENKNCKVSSLGKVTGLKKGTCSILVKVKNQNSKSLLLTVK